MEHPSVAAPTRFDSDANLKQAQAEALAGMPSCVETAFLAFDGGINASEAAMTDTIYSLADAADTLPQNLREYQQTSLQIAEAEAMGTIERSGLSASDNLTIKGWVKHQVQDIKVGQAVTIRATDGLKHHFLEMDEDKKRTYMTRIAEQRDQYYEELSAFVAERDFDTFATVLAEATQNIDMLLSGAESSIESRTRSQFDELVTFMQNAQNQVLTDVTDLRNRLNDWIKDAIHDPRTNHKKHATPQQPEEGPKIDPRVQALMNITATEKLRPAVSVVKSVDLQREKGRTDADIYRTLIKHFHPDKQKSDQSEDVMKILGVAYDKTTKTFIF
jgi:hypothetical protein